MNLNNLMQEVTFWKKDLIKTFVDSESGKYNENKSISNKEYYLNKGGIIFEKHKKFLEHSFEMIFSNFHPIEQYNYWKFLIPSYTPDCNMI
mmetsp:Transcript_16418/g.14337  ORF Transcript_16418/g.14337 Transcript_16418/m.14337 type:complete len:91 (+) Transcript_16418:326-598(+)